MDTSLNPCYPYFIPTKTQLPTVHRSYSLFQQNSNPIGNLPVKIVAAVKTVYKKAIILNNEHLLLYNEPLANADLIGIDPSSGWY